MKIIRPNVITDAMLVSSDIPETDYAEFAMGTTYASGARVMDSTGVEILTLDVAPATAWVAGRLLTGQSSSKTCRVVAQLTSLTYQIRERSGAFTLGEVVGVTGTAGELADQGAAHPVVTVAADKVHNVYESLAAGNVSNYPPHDLLVTVPKWKLVSATNRWKVFDDKVGSQASKTTSMNFVLAPGRINSIAFLNLDATEISIVQTDPVDGVTFSATYDLVSSVAIIDAYTYCFEPFIFLTHTTVFDLPPYELATLSITITNTGGVAKCGEIIMGLSTFLGTTLYGPSIGITDYSRKTADDEGNYSIAEGAFSRRGSYALKIPNTSINEIERVLSLYRATPLVWVGIDEIAATISYGIFKSFDIVISGPSYSDCSLDIEGLT